MYINHQFASRTGHRGTTTFVSCEKSPFDLYCPKYTFAAWIILPRETGPNPPTKHRNLKSLCLKSEFKRRLFSVSVKQKTATRQIAPSCQLFFDGKVSISRPRALEHPPKTRIKKSFLENRNDFRLAQKNCSSKNYDKMRRLFRSYWTSTSR